MIAASVAHEVLAYVVAPLIALAGVLVPLFIKPLLMVPTLTLMPPIEPLLFKPAICPLCVTTMLLM